MELPRLARQFVCVVVVALAIGGALSGQTFGPPPLVTRVSIIHENGLPTVEILSRGGPVIPQVQKMDAPLRLVIDLPNSRLGTALKPSGPFKREDIQALRVTQYQAKPPVTRIVVVLGVPYAYSWEGAGGRLLVRLRPEEHPNAAKSAAKNVLPEVPTATGISLEPAPAVVPVTGGAGAMVVAGSRLSSGATITAGSETTALRLARGGQILVCPGTVLSVTTSQTKRDLMLGLSTGAMEAHYDLRGSADAVLTPDFRVMLAGPGEFDFAISVDTHGNTCVRALPGNTSSAIVSELMGDRIYQVRPNEQVMFHSGRIDKTGTDVPAECGCPPPSPQLLAQAPFAPNVPDSELPARASIGGNESAAVARTGLLGRSTSNAVLSSGPETAPIPASEKNDVHMEIDAPLVFTPKSRASLAPPAPLDAARELPVHDLPARQVHLDAVIETPASEEPPNQPRKAEHHGFFGRVKGMFSAIFHSSSS